MILCTLVGNPNSGKEVLFNNIAKTESLSEEENSKMIKKEGYINDNIKLISFPGMYSIDVNASSENMFINYMNENKVDLIINMVNASALERNLYLTMQLKNLGVPMVILVSMNNKAIKKGLNIDYKKLSQLLGIHIIEIENFNIHNMNKVKDYIDSNNYSLENCSKNNNFQSEKEIYANIEEMLRRCAVVSNMKLENNLSEKLDRILLNKYLAYPIFIAIIYLVFKIVFTWVGTPLSDLFRQALFHYVIPFMNSMLINSSDWFRSLVVDGVISGISSVLVFLPIILVLFFVLSFLEDSGYMNRAAFLMDKVMSFGGLSGKAFMPMIIGFGCSVPAILAAKNIENQRERKIAAMLIPFMSCNAKLPVYMLFATIFFRGKEIVILAAMYLIGVITAYIYSIIFKFVLKNKEYEPYIDELAEYSLPNLKLLFKHTWEKGKGFLKKIGTIIFSMSIVTWVLSNFNFTGMVDINSSFLAYFGKFISPIFHPLGFGNWQNSVALITGLMGKEVIAGTLGVLYGGNLGIVITQHFSSISALSFLIFILLYTPCLSAIITIKKEFGLKMMITSIIYQFATAWITCFIFFNIAIKYF